MRTIAYSTEEELNEVLGQLARLFDVVRIVDPILTEVEGEDESCDCFDVWSKEARCRNCTSARVMVTGEPSYKYERIGQDIYMIKSERIETPKGARVLELVSRMDSRFEKYYRDKQEEMSALEELSVLALYDPLTGIFNRRYAEDTLPAIVQQPKDQGGNMVLAILDIDKLKTANDTFGHLVGDMLIKTVVSRILQVFPAPGVDEGFLARTGGDEFVMALRVSGKEEADALLEKIIASVGRGVLSGCPQVNPSISVGAVMLSECDQPTFGNLMGMADGRLYNAKRSGRGRFVSSGETVLDPPAAQPGEQRRYRRDEPFEAKD